MEYTITENQSVSMRMTPTEDSVQTTMLPSDAPRFSGSTGSDSEWNGSTDLDSSSYIVFFPLWAVAERQDADFWASSTSPIADLLAYGTIPISRKRSSTSGSTGLSPEEVEP